MMKPFAERFDLSDAGDLTPEKLAELVFNSIPDEGEQKTEQNTQASDELAGKVRALELEREKLMTQINGFDESRETAKQAGKREALTGYKVAEAILQNQSLSAAGKANPGAVSDGLIKHLAGKGIALQVNEVGQVVPRSKDGSPVFKTGSAEQADLQHLTNEYLTEKKWLAETATRGGGSLTQTPSTTNQAPQKIVPTHKLMYGGGF